MPPFAPAGWRRDPVWIGVARELAAALGSVANATAREALARVRDGSDAWLESQADQVLSCDREGLDVACAPVIGAALQVYWTHLAASLTPEQVARPEHPNLCPVCGSHPVASVVRVGGSESGLRYLQCALCSSEWHVVRTKCSNCDNGKDIAYYNVEGDAGIVRAEACPECETYLKVVYMDKDPHAEAMADDLASLALDVLMGEQGISRSGVNLLMVHGDRCRQLNPSELRLLPLIMGRSIVHSAQLLRPPAVDRVLSWPSVAPLLERYGRQPVLDAVRALLAELRQQACHAEDYGEAALVAQLDERLARSHAPRLQARLQPHRHRAAHQPGPRAAARGGGRRRWSRAARHPCALEYDLETGGRGDRDDVVEELLRELTGAEAATVVNNNAAAVFLLLNALALAQGGDRLARRTGRDRRRLPHARHHEPRRRQAGRGRHHQPHPPARLRARPSARAPRC